MMADHIIKKILTLVLCGGCALQAPAFGIVRVDSVVVESPEGTVPRLPYLVWTTYDNGRAEFRQVRWANSTLSVEQSQADKTAHPAGSEYQISGYVIGDNTTPAGYPIIARIKVTAASERYSALPASGEILPVIPSRTKSPASGANPIAEPLPLGSVTIDGDNRLTSNRDLAIRTILSWDVNQQLYNYRDTYGLPTDGYPRSDGWDSPTTKLKGHGTGHYMSALALAFASATDKTQKDSLRGRMRRMVDALRECQERTFVWNDSLGRYWEARDFAPEAELREMKGTWAAFDAHKKEYAKYGYGYLNAIPAHHAVLVEMYRPYNNEEWVWAPYYSIHKQLAGLIDIATYADDKAIRNKALLIAKDMGLWVWNRLSHRTYVKTDGTREERRATPGNRYEMWNMYIAGEDGGMGESLARLSEMVGEEGERARLLEASNFFDSPAFFNPLARNIDDIRTRHANQHIPKITSALRSYRGNGHTYYYNMATNFWNLIQGRYCYATGGVGNGEMFRQPYTQMLSMNSNVTTDRDRNIVPNPTLNETCCAYNLAKLTKDLNCYSPDDARYMDYYERVLYNQIVGSLHPEHYMTTYHYAVGLNASKPWGNETPQASCCGGTGSENHVKYQEAAYFANDNTLWVALYLPSTARWERQGVVIEQDCAWPAERSEITIVKGRGRFAMKLRVPYWATEGFDVRLNGVSVAAEYKPSSYVEIPARRWKKGDRVEVVMPFTKHIHFGPDKMETAATGVGRTDTRFTPMWVGTLMYGPLAMATQGITDWNQATVNIDAALDSIRANGTSGGTGTEGNIYTLTLAGRTFKPDYAIHKNSTHYLRLNIDGNRIAEAGVVDKQALRDAVKLADERQAAQEEWETLTMKVPEFAPWAPHGYARLMEQCAKAKGVLDSEAATQDEVGAAVAALNAAINSMRPGNLAEPEDLDTLLGLLRDVRQSSAISSPQGKEAVEYAEMVVNYVGDGSGTKDMIRKAEEMLKGLKR